MASVARFILKLFGWQLVGKIPDQKKYVIIVAPHTSNWDFFIFLLVKIAYRIDACFIGKDSLFIGPAAWFLKGIGGIPVERSSAHNVVDKIVSEFETRDKMIFALSPEGTRSYLDHWKSGFYHIARKAKVPVQTAFLDKRSKQIGWGPLFDMTDDKFADLEKIAYFYADKQGIKPHKFSKIEFRHSS